MNRFVQLLPGLFFVALAWADNTTPGSPYIVVLGIAQDGGVPQLGSEEHPAWDDPSLRRLPACLALVDPETGKRWLFEATPAIKQQLHRLHQLAPRSDRPGLDGIFLTHAHIGHYAGLLLLGHESLGAHQVPVYAMPRMGQFLANHGPWDQLLRYQNISLREMHPEQAVDLGNGLSVTPLLVPHRPEYSEVVGFRIKGPTRSVLFVPDIDSWAQWDEQGTRIEDLLAQVDIAYLDGTFFADGEIPGRDMSGFPHPRISRTMQRLAALPASIRQKVRFIHLNHSNPALNPESTQAQAVYQAGFKLAIEAERVEL
jgi:pyrroloquinoline quinone biosynthesis protein B